MRQLRKSVILGAVAIISACSLSAPDTKAEESVRFVVLSAESEALEGVDVEAIQKDGTIRYLGSTDPLGVLEISQREVTRDLLLLVFCKPGFYCGALRADDPEFLDYKEHLIALAPFMMR